jgi:uncharacterized protein (TIGR01244 family)
MPNPSSVRSLAAAVVALAAASFACAQQTTPAADAAAFIQGVTGHGQPDEQTLEQISAAGYAAVIDLRGPEENRGLEDERAAVEGRGMSYIPLPIVGEGAINYDNASELDRLVAQFDKPVFIHCGSGNRAGALLALRAKLNGADNETAVEAGLETGLSGLEKVVRQRLEER